MVSTLRRVAIPIIGPTMDDALRDMYEVTDRYSVAKFPIEVILELRLDYMRDTNVKRLREGSPLKKLWTNRVKYEAGPDPNAGFKGSEDERYALLQETIDYDEEKYADSEWKYPGDLRAQTGINFIRSWHNFKETPEDLEKIYRGIADTNADIIKIATMANNEQDSERMLRLIELARLEDRDIIGLCMGPIGLPTRIRGPSLGGYLTFASLKKGKESALGQITVEELVNTPGFF